VKELEKITTNADREMLCWGYIEPGKKKSLKKRSRRERETGMEKKKKGDTSSIEEGNPLERVVRTGWIQEKGSKQN